MLCPSVYWLDSSELAAAGFELGLLHAPGHPLAVLLSKGFQMLPLGDIALRAGLAQVFCGAGAAALVTAIGARLASKLCSHALASDLLGVTVGLAYGATYAAAFQAVRPEVYALSSLLTLATIDACLRYADDADPTHLQRAGLWFGLGLTNHHYLTLVGAVPPALVLLWPRRGHPGLAKGLLLGALATAAALTLYFYLPLRSAHDPIVRWGHPLDLRSFFWVVSAQSFQKSAGTQHGSDLPLLIGAALDQLGPIASLIGLGGLYVALRKLPRVGLTLLFAVLGPLAARWFLAFDSGNPDAFAYLGTGIAALALCAVPLCAELLEAAPRTLRPVGGATILLVVCVRAGLTLPGSSLAAFEDTRATFAPLLDGVSPGAVVVPSYFQTTFSLSYLRVVEGARPDLHFLPRHFLTHPGERAALARQDPLLAPLMTDRDLVADVVERTGGHPLWLEYDLDLPMSLVGTSQTISLPRTLSNELQTRRFLLWQTLLRLHRACRLGADPAAMPRSAEAELRAGASDDPERSRFLDELLASCTGARDH